MTLCIGGRVMTHEPAMVDRFERDGYEVTLAGDPYSAGFRIHAQHRKTGISVYRMLPHRDAQRVLHDRTRLVRLFDEMIEEATAKRDMWLRTQGWRP